ncbi:MAG: pyridoxal-phosphate dependent enzyme [Bacteroidia bacterium]|nr:pyridoxal-phosphate dependent enzyme [Bacteroidia bacterium]
MGGRIVLQLAPFSILVEMISSIDKSKFEKKLLELCDEALLYRSRVHKVPSFSQEMREVWVKREDESGFGISGAKKRKYASLIPFLKKSNFDKVILIGGSRSNHIAGFLQLLNENRIKYELFLKQEHNVRKLGNRLLLDLLADEACINWIPKDSWHEVEQIALERAEEESAFMLPEGGSCRAAFAGACTLGLDILKEGHAYTDVWIDSGTALMAGAVIEVLASFAPEVQLHVVQMAGDEDYFRKQLRKFHVWTEELVGGQLEFPTNFDLYVPAVGKSFGSVGGTILGFIKDFARTEGILTDPIYSGKLFYTVQQLLSKDAMPGRHLVVHSGGGVGLMGFGDKFPT